MSPIRKKPNNATKAKAGSAKKAPAKKPSIVDTISPMASLERLTELLNETNAELKEIQPKIDALEKHLAELHELKISKQRLLALKLSLEGILENQQSLVDPRGLDFSAASHRIGMSPQLNLSRSKRLLAESFYPDQALEAVDSILSQKHSLNHELYRAIVYFGGEATTEAIKAYLVENGIPQPQSGESFEGVPLTDISARVNYLVKKDLVKIVGRGRFRCTYGWTSDQQAGRSK